MIIVPMRMAMGMVIIVRMGMSVFIVIVSMDVEFHTFDAALVLSFRVQMEVMEVQLGEFALELLEGDAEVKQRADEHIAADATEDIQVKSFHLG